jgi:hypothetical protein
MPSNWPAWARQYLGNEHAPQTPANQETTNMMWIALNHSIFSRG